MIQRLDETLDVSRGKEEIVSIVRNSLLRKTSSGRSININYPEVGSIRTRIAVTCEVIVDGVEDGFVRKSQVEVDGYHAGEKMAEFHARCRYQSVGDEPLTWDLYHRKVTGYGRRGIGSFGVGIVEDIARRTWADGVKADVFANSYVTNGGSRFWEPVVQVDVMELLLKNGYLPADDASSRMLDRVQRRIGFQTFFDGEGFVKARPSRDIVSEMDGDLELVLHKILSPKS